MLAGHPRGLYIAFFANMGERFGFYTMMAILVLFLQAKYNLPENKAGLIYSVFYFLIYALALVGGLIADRTQKYRATILVGIVVMFCGYVIMAVPGMGLPVALLGLLCIALGNGLFKGNLQALVGQMYDDPSYAHLRDTAFSVFYMGINIGAVFAPNAARAVRTWYLGTHGLKYDADLPSLCNRFLDGDTSKTDALAGLAVKATGATVTDLRAFAQNYMEVFTTGYNYAFGIAACAMLVSLTVYVFFKHWLPDRKSQGKAGAGEVPAMPKEQERQRLVALGLVFVVVIFFWMAFHQNGLTMTYFARDYTVKAIGKLSYLAFDIRGLLLIASTIAGIVFLARGPSPLRRGLGAALALGCPVLAFWLYSGYGERNPIEPEAFQQFNPYFVVFLTPVVIAVFGALRARNKEPSTPRKIGIGMILAALGFVIMLASSTGLPSPAELAGQPSSVRVSEHWLISTYLVLTVAELFLSPMGLSFVSKVAPPRFQGLMQGGWLGATALGNQLLFVGSSLWMVFPVWAVWLVFVVCCLVSATFIFSILKRLEKATA